jgi:stress-induced morphogen
MKINTAKVLEEKLNKYLEPSYLNVRDDSHKHQGHAGVRKVSLISILPLFRTNSMVVQRSIATEWSIKY